MRKLYKPLHISVLFFLIGISFFFVYTEWFPLWHFFFNFALLGTLTLIFFIFTKKIYASIVIAGSLLIGIMAVSLIKQHYMGVFFHFSDFMFFFTDPLFVLQFVSLPIFVTSLLSVLIYIGLLYKHEKRTKFTVVHLAFLMLTSQVSFYYFHKFTNLPSSRFRVQQGSLQTFILSLYSDSLTLVPAELNDATCCQIINNKDIAIKNSDAVHKPNIVFILLESTFNLSSIPILGLDDQWKDYLQKPLGVHTTGGMTWTAEYAVLHGINPEKYGPKFPFINVLGPGILQGRIAPALTDIGYRTYSFLPHKRNFANSNNFHKSLGIKNIYDCTNNKSCEFITSKKMDTMMFDQVYNILRTESEPTFVFALTRHQHSPHGFSKPNSQISCSNLGVSACNVLQEYKNREEYLQKHINEFITKLNSLPKETIVIFFGDHIPLDIKTFVSIEQFKNQTNLITFAFGYSNRTKQFIDLHTIISDQACNPDFRLQVEDLDILPLHLVGMRSEYISQKYAKLQSSCMNPLNFTVANSEQPIPKNQTVEPPNKTRPKIPRIAHAGGEYMGAIYTDSIEALNTNADKYDIFEIDLNFTSDNKLACIHDWHQYASYKRNFYKFWKKELVPPDLKTFERRVSQEQKWTNCTLDTLIEWLNSHPDKRIVTDIKSKNIKALKLIAQKYPNHIKRFIPQIYKLSEWNNVRALGYHDIILTLYKLRGNRMEKTLLALNKTKYDLFALALPRDKVEKFSNYLINSDIPVYTYTVNDQKEFELMKTLGVDEFYTDGYLTTTKQAF